MSSFVFRSKLINCRRLEDLPVCPGACPHAEQRPLQCWCHLKMKLLNYVTVSPLGFVALYTLCCVFNGRMSIQITKETRWCFPLRGHFTPDCLITTTTLNTHAFRWAMAYGFCLLWSVLLNIWISAPTYLACKASVELWVLQVFWWGALKRKHHSVSDISRGKLTLFSAQSFVCCLQPYYLQQRCTC